MGTVAGRWHVADALEWLRRYGISEVRHQPEDSHYVFFEFFEEHWLGLEPEDERLIGSPAPGVELAYRTYPTELKPEQVRDPRSVAGGKRTIRVFKFRLNPKRSTAWESTN